MKIAIVGAHPTIQTVDASQFPLAIGGAATAIPLPSGAGSLRPDEVVAALGVDDRALFVEPRPGVTATCNGSAFSSSQWLQAGDVVRLMIATGAFDLRIERDADDHDTSNLRVIVLAAATDNVTEPPRFVSSPLVDDHAGRGDRRSVDGVTTIAPVAFTPRAIERRDGRRPLRPTAIALWLIAALLGVAAWLVFSSRSVELAITPSPDRLSVTGGLVPPPLAGAYLLRSGRYQIVAEREGHHRLEQSIEVGDAASQVFRFELAPLPGSVAITTQPAGAQVRIDGDDVGVTPLAPIELEAGSYQLDARLARHRAYRATLEVVGRGQRQDVVVELEPAWADVAIDSSPRGATIRLDGDELAVSPATVEVGAGAHELELTLAGYKDHRATIEVVANRPQTIPVVRLEPADARLEISSTPSAATVSVDGTFRGSTPLTLTLAPSPRYVIELSAAGHTAATESVALRAGERRTLDVELAPIFGDVEVRSTPADAELWIDGERDGNTGRSVRLSAVEHIVEARKPGFANARATVTPRPGFAQTIELVLERSLSTSSTTGTAAGEAPSNAGASTASTVAASTTPPHPNGHRLVVAGRGRMTMGASRREPGRRANETLHDVELSRPFLIATHEVSNGQFRAFRPGHSSGNRGGKTLDSDDQPVVAITWDDAASYCNWLSEQASLAPAYVDDGGAMRAVTPMTTGYRMATEAEWALSARQRPGRDPLKYPWGDTLPVAAGSGNYADQSARAIVGRAIDGYDDGFAVAAKVGSFPAGPHGLFDLGGNVAEWVHDLYGPTTGGELERDPMGPARGQHHVIRGASWMHSTVTELRLSYRDYGKTARPDVGFRIARYTN